MATYTGVHIVSAERLRNSANGNPRWHMTLDVAPFTATTEPDAQCGYTVDNYAGRDVAVTIVTNSAGGVTTISEEN